MRLSRRLALSSLVLAAVLLLAGGIAILFRQTLAETIIVRAFASRGAQAGLQVAKLDWNEIVIEEFSVETLRIEHLQISYSIGELIGGQIRTANIAGMSLSVDLTGNGPPLGKLQQLIPEMGDAGSVAPASTPIFPAITVQDALITVLLPEDTVALTAHGEVTPNDAGNTIALDFETQSGPILASGEMTASLIGTTIASLAMETNLTDEANAFAFALNAITETPDPAQPEIQLTLSGQGEIAPLAQYAALEDAQIPQSGNFQMNAQGSLTVPIEQADRFHAAQGDMTFALAISELSIPDLAELPAWMLDRLNADTSGTLTLREASITGAWNAAIGYAARPTTFAFTAPETTMVLNEDYSLGPINLNAFSTNMTAVPTPYGTLGTASIAGNVTDLTSEPAGTVQLHATSPALTIASTTARGTVIDASAALSSTDEGYLLALNAPARFSISTLNLPAMLPIEGLGGQIRNARLDLKSEQSGFSFSQSAAMTLPPFSFLVERGDTDPILFEIETGPIAVQSAGAAQGPIRFTVSTRVNALRAPELGMLTQNADLNIVGILGGEVRATMREGLVSHAVESPLFTPLAPDIVLLQNGDHLSFDGNLSGADGFLTVSLQGEHDIGTGSGNMRFALDDLAFGPGGANGNAVSPILATMQNLRGHVNGEANFSWDSEGFENGALINLQQIAFRRDSMTFQDVSTQLNLSNLFPARSPPGQELRIARIETGLEDVTAFELRYRLDTTEDGTPRVYTEALGMNIAGGRITADSGSFDPTTGASTIPLRAENLDLARLLSHIGLEELTGVGQLNGIIPFTMSVNGASIEGATLQANAPGIVTYRSARAREALATGGESVNLMLDALEDFHYDNLGLTLSKPVAGDTAITLRMEGSNPAVLDGNPFDINISLTGDAAPLLQALLAGQRLSDDLIRSMSSQ